MIEDLSDPAAYTIPRQAEPFVEYFGASICSMWTRQEVKNRKIEMCRSIMAGSGHNLDALFVET